MADFLTPQRPPPEGGAWRRHGARVPPAPRLTRRVLMHTQARATSRCATTTPTCTVPRLRCRSLRVPRSRARSRRHAERHRGTWRCRDVEVCWHTRVCRRVPLPAQAPQRCLCASSASVTQNGHIHAAPPACHPLLLRDSGSSHIALHRAAAVGRAARDAAPARTTSATHAARGVAPRRLVRAARPVPGGVRRRRRPWRGCRQRVRLSSARGAPGGAGGVRVPAA